jgi:hypothetical protein
METDSNKPRSISLLGLDSSTSKPTKLIPLDLKKLREERLSNKNSTPKYQKKVKSDTLFKFNSIEEQWKQYKSVGKLKTEENKLIFYKDTRPKSALRGQDETQELIKIAESAIELFSQKKTLEIVEEFPLKKVNTTQKNFKASTQKAVTHAGLMNLIKGAKKEISIKVKFSKTSKGNQSYNIY